VKRKVSRITLIGWSRGESEKWSDQRVIQSIMDVYSSTAGWGEVEKGRRKDMAVEYYVTFFLPRLEAARACFSKWITDGTLTHKSHQANCNLRERRTRREKSKFMIILIRNERRKDGVRGGGGGNELLSDAMWLSAC
jgi:hypothetical protein